MKLPAPARVHLTLERDSPDAAATPLRKNLCDPASMNPDTLIKIKAFLERLLGPSLGFR